MNAALLCSVRVHDPALILPAMFERLIATVNRNRNLRLTIASGSRELGWRLAPARCLLCDAPGAQPHVDLCGFCLATLPAETLCWQPGALPVRWALCPWRYDYPLDALVRALKFGGERAYARLLGTLLARHRAALPECLPQLVAPVPLHPRRLLQRGYNQAGEIARFAARPLGLSVDFKLLRRVRNTQAQSALPASGRRANTRGAFVANRELAGLRVALVDDVMTTGSTAQAAAMALTAAGATDIELWVLARVARGATSVSARHTR
jgi:ComF family protein